MRILPSSLLHLALPLLFSVGAAGVPACAAGTAEVAAEGMADGTAQVSTGADSPRLRVEAAWIRAAPPNAAVLAGYATLHNDGESAVAVAPCRADGVDVSLHETTLVDGVSRMRPLAALDLSAHATTVFAPGGMHLMLSGLSPQPQIGQRVVLCLAVDGSPMPVEFEVRRAPPGDEHHHH